MNKRQRKKKWKKAQAAGDGMVWITEGIINHIRRFPPLLHDEVTSRPVDLDLEKFLDEVCEIRKGGV